MDEHQFDKDLKNILENSPPFEASKQAVDDMRTRLDQAYGRHPWRVPWWWWIPLLILPFASGMIFFFMKFQNLNNKLDDITLQLKSRQIDTITQHHTIYHFDTIYTKTIITQGGEQPFLAPNYWTTNGVSWTANWDNQHPFTAAVPPFFYEPGSLPKSKETLLDQIKNGRITLGDLRFSSSFPEQTENDIDTRSWSPMHTINGPEPSFLMENGFASEKIRSVSYFSSPQTRPIRKPLVQGVQLGAFVGTAALEEHLSALIWEANLDLMLSRRWRLRTGFQQIGIEFEEKEDDHFDNYPLISPDNPGDELEEIKANYSFARIPLRLIYTFHSTKSIQPYLGIGISGIRAVRPELQYEFRGSAGEYYRNLSFNMTSVSIKNLEFGVGLEFYLGKGLNASLEGFRFQNFDKNLEQINRISHFGGKVGLHYSF